MTLPECDRHYGEAVFENNQFTRTYSKDGYKIFCQTRNQRVFKVVYSRSNKEVLSASDIELFMKVNAPSVEWKMSHRTSGGIVTHSHSGSYSTITELDLSKFTILKKTSSVSIPQKLQKFLPAHEKQELGVWLDDSNPTIPYLVQILQNGGNSVIIKKYFGDGSGGSAEKHSKKNTKIDLKSNFGEYYELRGDSLSIWDNSGKIHSLKKVRYGG